MFRILICVLSLAACFRAEAVVVYGTNGNGTNNTSAPADDPGWANVGTVAGCTAVYLGSETTGYWMLTAMHVPLSGPVLMPNGSYAIVSGSASQIGTSDLQVFRLQTDPGLSAVTIASAAPAPDSSVVMIGNGRDQGAYTTWDSNWGSPGSTASGYEWGSNQIVRWGTNVVQNKNLYVTNTGRPTMAFSTVFNDTLNPNEAQASLGDSGGGVFSKNGRLWELTGIMFSVGVWDGRSGGYYNQFTGQPSDVSLDYFNTGYLGAGSATFSAQLSTYRSVILAAIPEPSSFAMALFALFAGLMIRRRAT